MEFWSQRQLDSALIVMFLVIFDPLPSAPPMNFHVPLTDDLPPPSCGHRGDRGGRWPTCWGTSGTFSSRCESRTTNILVTVELLLPSLQTEEVCEGRRWAPPRCSTQVLHPYLVTATARTATRPAGSRMGRLYFLPLAAGPLGSDSGLDPSRV